VNKLEWMSLRNVFYFQAHSKITPLLMKNVTVLKHFYVYKS
jgi:hypothetical protein